MTSDFRSGLKPELQTKNNERRTKNMNTTTTRKTFGTHSVHAAADLPLKGLVHWQVNPRHDLTAGGEEMRESLLAVGQMDDVHVWKCIDGDKILRGNRRVANMRRLGWTECRQVVHEFSDERDAYLFLLEDRGFGHSMDLSADEKILAVENGVKMGMSAEDMQACLGVTEERVQLWWELGESLPAVARDALHVGTLSMATAQLLLKIDDKDGRREAAQMILKDLDGEPMAPGQAKNVIELQFVLPEKWRKAWAVLEPKLKKKLKVMEGFHFVPWEQRMEFVQGNSGQPLPEFEFATVMRPRSSVTWGEAAVKLEVPRYVVPAPQHVDGHVLLVNVRMIRDAEYAAAQGGGGEEAPAPAKPVKPAVPVVPETPVKDDGNDRSDLSDDAGDGLKPELQTEAEEGPLMTDEERAWVRTALGGIEQALLDAPTDAMGKGPWEPLMEFLCHEAVGGAALEAWKGITTLEEAQTMVASDRKIRWYLRQPLLLLLCAQMDAASDVEAGKVVITAVMKALGVTARGAE